MCSYIGSIPLVSLSNKLKEKKWMEAYKSKAILILSMKCTEYLLFPDSNKLVS